MIELPKLESILRTFWSRETSSDPKNWSEENPAWGQCAVTSLIANDYLGGEIVWASARLPDGREVSHYFNKIDDKEIDLTRTQFQKGTHIPAGIPKTKNYQTTREYILSYTQTRERYDILKNSIEKHLTIL